MLRARTLYCRKLRDKADVAKTVGVTVGDMDRWIMTQDWEKLRHETEFKYYQRVTGIRRKSIPNIDEKEDLAFHNLESLIEDTIFRIKRDEIEVPPRDLVSLANAMKICMDSRRTIHNKEGPAKRHVFQIDDPTLLNEFTGMVLDLTGAGKSVNGDPQKTKQITYSEDVELEDEKDLV
jgi:hypothetical protein